MYFHYILTYQNLGNICYTVLQANPFIGEEPTESCCKLTALFTVSQSWWWHIHYPNGRTQRPLNPVATTAAPSLYLQSCPTTGISLTCCLCTRIPWRTWIPLWRKISSTHLLGETTLMVNMVSFAIGKAKRMSCSCSVLIHGLYWKKKKKNLNHFLLTQI